MFSYIDHEDRETILTVNVETFKEMIEFMTPKDIDYALSLIETTKKMLELEAEMALESEIDDNLDQAKELLDKYTK